MTIPAFSRLVDGIRVLLRLVLLALILNVVRYIVGMPIEQVTIMEPMHRMLPPYPEVFNVEFKQDDILVSLGYNYVLWFAAALAFHLFHRALRGTMIVRSLKVFSVMLLFFCAIAAVYMNHYTTEIKSFYLWSMVDALILFPLVGVANGLLYPLLMDSTGA